jgi:hypothetical protein
MNFFRLVRLFLVSIALLAGANCSGASHSNGAGGAPDDDLSPADDDSSPDDDDDDDFVWSQMPGSFAALFAVWGSASSDVYAVGGATNNGNEQSAIVHFDGSRWIPIKSGEGPFYLTAISGTSAANVIAVGKGGQSAILRFDGAAWVNVSVADGLGFLQGVWAASEAEFFVVSYEKTDGIAGRFDGANWTIFEDNLPPLLFAVWGASPSDVFIGGYGISHFDGNVWTSAPGIDDTEMYCSFWGSSATDVFAVGNPGSPDAGPFTAPAYPSVIVHYDGQSWSEMRRNATDVLSGIWGTSPTDVFAVGGSEAAENIWQDTILHYDGSSWSVMDRGSFPVYLRNAWGSSPGDVFAVGYDANFAAGVILHYGPPE